MTPGCKLAGSPGRPPGSQGPQTGRACLATAGLGIRLRHQQTASADIGHSIQRRRWWWTEEGERDLCHRGHEHSALKKLVDLLQGGQRYVHGGLSRQEPGRGLDL